MSHVWVFKNRPSKICGRQPSKNLKYCGLHRPRLSFTNLTWSIFEYLDPYITLRWHKQDKVWIMFMKMTLININDDIGKVPNIIAEEVFAYWDFVLA